MLAACSQRHVHSSARSGILHRTPIGPRKAIVRIRPQNRPPSSSAHPSRPPHADVADRLPRLHLAAVHARRARAVPPDGGSQPEGHGAVHKDRAHCPGRAQGLRRAGGQGRARRFGAARQLLQEGGPRVRNPAPPPDVDQRQVRLHRRRDGARPHPVRPQRRVAPRVQVRPPRDRGRVHAGRRAEQEGPEKLASELTAAASAAATLRNPPCRAAPRKC